MRAFRSHLVSISIITLKAAPKVFSKNPLDLRPRLVGLAEVGVAEPHTSASAKNPSCVPVRIVAVA